MTPKAFAEKYGFDHASSDIAEDLCALLAHVRRCERRRVLKALRKIRRFNVDMDGEEHTDDNGTCVLFDDCARIAAGPRKGKKR